MKRPYDTEAPSSKRMTIPLAVIDPRVQQKMMQMRVNKECTIAYIDLKFEDIFPKQPTLVEHVAALFAKL